MTRGQDHIGGGGQRIGQQTTTKGKVVAKNACREESKNRIIGRISGNVHEPTDHRIFLAHSDADLPPVVSDRMLIIMTLFPVSSIRQQIFDCRLPTLCR